MASYALTMPAGYFTKPGRTEFNEPCLVLVQERLGQISEHDCTGDAIYAAQEHEANAASALAEAVEAERIAVDLDDDLLAVVAHVQDFLRALDRGHLGDVLRFSDGSESAYVSALRDAVATFERRPSW